MADCFVDIAPLGPIPDLLTYALPPEWRGLVRPGMRVLVPLGERVVTGCVVALQETPPVDTPKFVLDVLDDQPALTPDLLLLTQWMAGYYMATWGETIRAALPRALQSGSVQTVTLTAKGKAAAASQARGTIETRILTALAQHRSLTLKQLQRQMAGSGLRHAIQRLAAEALVEVVQKVMRPASQAPTEHLMALARSPEEIKSALQPMERRAPQQAALLHHLLHSGPATAAVLRRHIPGATQ
jgi:primosomal protein N' (replication factor Y)